MGGSLLTQCMAEVVQSAGTKIHPRFEFSREEVAPGQFEVCVGGGGCPSG